MNAAREVFAVARLDLAEALRSRWLVFCVVTYGLLGAAFVFVGMRESSVTGFSGMGRALLSLVHSLLLVLPLLALTATGQVVNRARDDGTLELLFSHPVRRTSYVAAIAIVRYVVLVLPLIVLVFAMGFVGRIAFQQAIDWPFLVQAMTVSAALVAAFVGLGIAVSTFVRSQARAVIWILVLWASSVALLDMGLIGVMLEWRLNPATIFLIASANPVECARMALLSGASPDLGALGPVGFFLMTRVGPRWLYTLGVFWPLTVGAIAWLLAHRHFRKADIV